MHPQSPPAWEKVFWLVVFGAMSADYGHSVELAINSPGLILEKWDEEVHSLPVHV
jgi:hypothetical protein